VITCDTHDWTEEADTAGQWMCATCGHATTGCSLCSRPLTTNLLVCEPCLDRAQRVISDVAQWMATFEFGVQIINLRAIRYDRDKVTSSDDDARLPFGLDAVISDPEDTRISALKHPDDAAKILYDWADAWADHRTEHTGHDPLGYLLGHTLWAIQNPDTSDWDQYIHEARQVRSTIRRLLGIAPEREAVPCVHCGGRIIREWTEDGLDDTRRCTGCGTTWDTHARLLHTNSLVLHQLPTTHPDTLVTTEQARRIYPQLHPATLRKWVQREHITEQDRDVRGVPLYRLADIAARMDTATSSTGGSAA
jgi:hypothetical protein